jgi:hypothetical protein
MCLYPGDYANDQNGTGEEEEEGGKPAHCVKEKGENSPLKGFTASKRVMQLCRPMISCFGRTTSTTRSAIDRSRNEKRKTKHLSYHVEIYGRH